MCAKLKKDTKILFFNSAHVLLISTHIKHRGFEDYVVTFMGTHDGYVFMIGKLDGVSIV